MTDDGYRCIATLEHDAEIADIYISEDGLRLGVEVRDNDRPLWVWNLKTLTVEGIFSRGFGENRLEQGLASAAEDGSVMGKAFIPSMIFEDGSAKGIMEIDTWQIPLPSIGVGYCDGCITGYGLESFAVSSAGTVGFEIRMDEYQRTATINGPAEVAVGVVEILEYLEGEDGGFDRLGTGQLCSPVPFSRDGRFLATFDKRRARAASDTTHDGPYGCCRIWRLTDKRAVEIPVRIRGRRTRYDCWNMPSFADGRVPVAFSPCSNLVAVACEGPQIGIWNLRSLFGESRP